MPVERRFRVDIGGHVGDVHAEPVAAVGPGQTDGVIEVPGGRAVDGDDIITGKIIPPRPFPVEPVLADGPVRLFQSLRGVPDRYFVADEFQVLVRFPNAEPDQRVERLVFAFQSRPGQEFLTLAVQGQIGVAERDVLERLDVMGAPVGVDFPFRAFPDGLKPLASS